MIEQTLPLLLQYHDAWNHFVEFHGQRVDQAASESRSHYARAHRVILSLILLSAGLCGVIGFFVTRLMTKEIDRREKAEQQVSSLNAGLNKKSFNVRRNSAPQTQISKRKSNRENRRRSLGTRPRKPLKQRIAAKAFSWPT
jgi:hypothetical protein